jgi:hypothetical protein
LENPYLFFFGEWYFFYKNGHVNTKFNFFIPEICLIDHFFSSLLLLFFDDYLFFKKNQRLRRKINKVVDKDAKILINMDKKNFRHWNF